MGTTNIAAIIVWMDERLINLILALVTGVGNWSEWQGKKIKPEKFWDYAPAMEFLRINFSNEIFSRIGFFGENIGGA